MQRTKGHSFEREIAIQLREVFPEAKRHLEFQADEAAHGVDLVNTGKLGIQCKRMKKYASLSKIKEVKRGIPALVTKGDREEILIALPLKDFIEILKDPSYVQGEINVVIQEKEKGEK